VARQAASAQVDDLGDRSWSHSRNSWACSGPHLDGVLAWANTRLSNGAVEGMSKKINRSVTGHSDSQRGCVPKCMAPARFWADWREMGVSARHQPAEVSFLRRRREIACFPRRRSAQLLAVGAKWKSPLRRKTMPRPILHTGHPDTGPANPPQISRS